jgi:hypothetical protein
MLVNESPYDGVAGQDRDGRLLELKSLMKADSPEFKAFIEDQAEE